jgi:hypothetical protein
MSRKRIVYTRHDGGVSICAPSLTALRYMTSGGGRWDAEIRHLPSGFLDRQIERQARHGVGEWAAARFVRAMQFGGLTDAEAYGVMRDRFCAHLGTGCELWDVEDVPTERTYRDAWRRSHNGGPIIIDPKAAQEIDEARAWQDYAGWKAACLQRGSTYAALPRSLRGCL